VPQSVAGKEYKHCLTPHLSKNIKVGRKKLDKLAHFHPSRTEPKSRLYHFDMIKTEIYMYLSTIYQQYINNISKLE
jgi:hypothetical protein